MRERTFTSYINAEVAPGAEANMRRLERMVDRTMGHIQSRTAAAARATAGLAGGGASTGLARGAPAAAVRAGSDGTRIAAANAAITRTSAVTTAQLARQSAEIGRLERRNAAMVQGLRSSATALQVVQGPLGPIAGRITALSNALERLTGFRLGIATVGAAIFALTAAANKASEIRTKLNPLYETQNQVNAAFERTAKIARDTRTALEPVVELYARLTMVGRDVGLSDRTIEKTTRAAALGARISGGSGQAQQAALIQLGQGIGSNRLGGEELRSVMEQAPRIAKAIADGLSNTEEFGKITMGMLRGLAAEGELTAERVTRALGRSLHQLEEEAKRIGPTMSSSMSSFGTEFTVAISSLDQAIGLTRTMANGIQFAADNMREMTALVVGLGVAWAAMRVAPALGSRISQLDTYITKQQRALNIARIGAQVEQRAATANLAALTRYNAALAEKQARLAAVTRQAEGDVTRTRAAADNPALRESARIEQRGGFQAGAARELARAQQAAERAERRLIAIRRQGVATTTAVADAERRLASATARVEAAQRRAVTTGSRWRTVGRTLLGAINPLGIAVSILTIAIFELAMAESRAEKNARRLEEIQSKLAETIDDTTGKIREQNEELRRGIALQSKEAEGLAIEQLAGSSRDVAKEAFERLRVGSRAATAEERSRGTRGSIRTYVSGAGGQQAQAALNRLYSSQGDPRAIARELEAIAAANPENKKMRAAADEVSKSLPGLVAQWRAVETERSRQREALGKGTEEDRRRLRGDWTGGRVDGRTPEQLNAEAEAERGRLKDPRYRARTSMDRSLKELDLRRGQMSAPEYIRERAEVLRTYDQEIESIEKTEAAAGRRGEAEAARQERLAEAARERREQLDNLMTGFEDNAPVKQLEKVFDQAERARRQLHDLIGEQVEGMGRFTADEAEKRIREIDQSVQKQSREFLDQTMERFEDDTPIRRMRQLATAAREAKKDIDALVGRSVAGYEQGFTEDDATQLKGRIDSYVETERRRPFTEALQGYREQYEIQQLVLAGREAEAAALERALELQKTMGPLTAADLEILIQQEERQRAMNILLEQRARIVENLVSVADDARNTIEAALGQLGRGRVDRAAQQLFEGMTESYFRVRVRQMTERLMEGTDQRVRDLVNGRTRVDSAINQVTTGMGTAGDAALTFAERLREAAARVADAPAAAAGMPAPTTPAAVDAVVGTVLRRSETVANRFLQIANPLTRMFVGGDNHAEHQARGSSGVDLRAPLGTSVYAPFTGRLTTNSTERGGNQAFITSLDGRVRVGFSHLNAVMGQLVGKTVQMGQIIARTGNTGTNPRTGRNVDPHLHTSLTVEGRRVDPMRYFGTTIDGARVGTERATAAGGGITSGAARTQITAVTGVIGDLAQRAKDFAGGFDWLKDVRDGDEPMAEDRHSFFDAMSEAMSKAPAARGGEEAAGKPPSLRKLYNEMGRDIGKNIDKALGSKFAEKIGGKLGDVVSGAQKGQMASGVARMLGIKQSNTGAQIGGAIGQLAAPFLGPLAPFAPFIGGLLGGTVGGMFKKTPQGSTNVSVGQFGDFVTGGTKGSSSALRDAADALGGSVGAGLSQIADALYGEVSGAGSVSIGKRKDKFTVDPTGQGRTKGSGVLKFDDEQAAIEAATKIMIQKGVIGGISGASSAIIQKGKDLQTAIQKAAAIESIPRRLMAIQDPVRFAVMELNREYAKLIQYMKEGGATAEQFAEAAKLYGLERQQAEEQARQQTSSQIQSFLDDMMGGSNSPLNRRTVYANSREQIDRFTSDINAGKVVEQGKLLEAARNYQDASRTLNGSSQDFFTDFDWLAQLLTKARDNANAGIGSDPLPGSPFEGDPQIAAMVAAANGTTTAINDQSNFLGAKLDRLIEAALAAANGGKGSSIGILPGFGGGGGGGGGGRLDTGPLTGAVWQ